MENTVQPGGAAPLNPAAKIPGKGEIVFNKDGFVLEEKTYNYNTVTGMYYNTVKTSVNLIPVSQAFYAGLRFGRERLDFSFASMFYIGNKKLEEVYTFLVVNFINFIEPWILMAMVRDIFSSGKTVIIGGVEFSKEGYRKKKLFGGYDTVLWTDKVYMPQMAEGFVYVYKDKRDKAAVFKTLRMQEPNAVLLPGLVEACYNKYSLRN